MLAQGAAFQTIFLRTKGIKSEFVISNEIAFCWHRACVSINDGPASVFRPNSNEIVSLSVEADFSRLVCKHAFAQRFVCCALSAMKTKEKNEEKTKAKL